MRPKLRELNELRTHVSHLTAPSEAATASIGRCVPVFSRVFDTKFPILTRVLSAMTIYPPENRRIIVVLWFCVMQVFATIGVVRTPFSSGNGS